jgi:hypothetical protein
MYPAGARYAVIAIAFPGRPMRRVLSCVLYLNDA